MEVLYWTLCCQQNLPQTKKKSLAYFAISPALRNSIFQIHFLLQLQQKGRQAFVLVESEKQREKKKKVQWFKKSFIGDVKLFIFYSSKAGNQKETQSRKGILFTRQGWGLCLGPFYLWAVENRPCTTLDSASMDAQAAVLNFLKDSPWGSWLKFRLPNFRSTGPVEGEHPGF